MRRIIYILANVILSAIIFASCSGVDEENTVNGFEYVDLGLPSGTKWATSNIGAKVPESAGSYFAWGEISESNYTEAECETCNLSVADLTKHEIIKSLRLTADYDAATYNMGIGWQTPTKQQYEELKTNCTWIWQDKPSGYKIVAKNGKSIFLPTTGYMSDGRNLNYANQGFYWTSEVESGSSKNAIGLGFSSNEYNIKSYYRDGGRCIRAVTSK